MPSANTAIRPASSSATESSLLRRARPVSVTLKNSRIMRTAKYGDGLRTRELFGDCALECGYLCLVFQGICVRVFTGGRIGPRGSGRSGLGGYALTLCKTQF